MAVADYVASSILILAAVIVAIAYLVRVMVAGRARFERIERQGGSRLLGQRFMEMAYWAMVPVGEGLAALNISANALTWSTLGFGAAAGLCLAKGYFGIAALWAAIAASLDAMDGIVARFNGPTSASGKVLDSTLDRYVEFFFLCGLVVRYSGNPELQLLTLFAILASFMVSYTTALAEIQKVDLPRGSMRRPERMVYLVFGAALGPFSSYPMIVALALVAVVGNISAFSRLDFMIRTLNGKSPVQGRARTLKSPPQV